MGFEYMKSPEWSKERKIYILGAGIEGIRAEYYLKDYVSIEGFIDNYVDGMTGSRGLIIQKPEKIVNDNNIFIVVAVSENNYEQVKEQLIRFGLSEFHHFIYWRLFGKKMVYLHGNCHMLVIKEMLMTSMAFNESFGLYPLKCIQDMKVLDKKVVEESDVIVSQDIRDENAFGESFCLSHIEKIASDVTRVVVIPNLFGMGKAFFPQDIPGSNRPIGIDLNGLFPREDKVINDRMKKGWDFESIKNEIKNKCPISEQEVLENFNIVFSKFKERMLKCDINEYDFIINNYQNVQLFYDVGHPTNILIKDMVIKILRLLEINDDCDENVICLDGHEVLLYPCVSRVLKLKWNKQSFRQSCYGKKLCLDMDMDEYIKEYIWWRGNNT